MHSVTILCHALPGLRGRTGTVISCQDDVAEVLVEFDKQYSTMIFQVPCRNLAPSNAPIVKLWVEPPEPIIPTTPPLVVGEAQTDTASEAHDELAILQIKSGAERDRALNHKLRLRERGVAMGADALKMREQEWERLQVLRWEQLQQLQQTRELTRVEKQMLSKFGNQFCRKFTGR